MVHIKHNGAILYTTRTEQVPTWPLQHTNRSITLSCITQENLKLFLGRRKRKKAINIYTYTYYKISLLQMFLKKTPFFLSRASHDRLLASHIGCSKRGKTGKEQS